MIARPVLCFSHLRWNLGRQRPYQLMSRCAEARRVLFVEEPVFDADEAYLDATEVLPNLVRVRPHVPVGCKSALLVAALLERLCAQQNLTDPVHWLYTDSMLELSQRLPNCLTIYDCMDAVAPAFEAREQQLLAHADLVFAAGMQLYQTKTRQHPNVYAMPSGVDAAFFAQARGQLTQPADQAQIEQPRIGFCGVLDTRIDLPLVAHIARVRPDWQLVLLGPVAAPVDAQQLPHAANIHYLGAREYRHLPNYLAHWDAAIMPYALGRATRYISPSETPEFLAAGKRVVSTAIADVVEPYERLGLVGIGRNPDEFVEQLELALQPGPRANDALRDEVLDGMSWDDLWYRMDNLVQQHSSSSGRRARERRGRVDRGVHA
jgi:UDP-galactopyranose mutase